MPSPLRPVPDAPPPNTVKSFCDPLGHWNSTHNVALSSSRYTLQLELHTVSPLVCPRIRRVNEDPDARATLPGDVGHDWALVFSVVYGFCAYAREDLVVCQDSETLKDPSEPVNRYAKVRRYLQHHHNFFPSTLGPKVNPLSKRPSVGNTSDPPPCLTHQHTASCHTYDICRGGERTRHRQSFEYPQFAPKEPVRY